MYKEAIGIIGTGSVATLDFFRRLVEAFPGEKEWDRPRIFIDNDCKMPSRDRAVLLNENLSKLKTILKNDVRQMFNLLKKSGGYIVIPCGTVFYWIDELRFSVPDANIIDLVDICGEHLARHYVANTTVIGTEGTYKIKLYDANFEKHNIHIHHPVEQFKEYRDLIEDVKQCKVNDKSIESFIRLINSSPTDTVVLACTDLPVIYDKCPSGAIKKKIVDPLEIAIQMLLRVLK